MTPADLKATREGFGLSQEAWARVLGLEGDDADRTIRRWEAGKSAIPGSVKVLVGLMRLPIVRRTLGLS